MMSKKRITAKVLFKNQILSIPDMVNEWKKNGIEEVFTLEDLYTDPEFQIEISKTDIKTWVIIQTFLNIENIDSLYAIKSDGTKAIGEGKGRWLRMICPNGGPDYSENSNYLKSLTEKIVNYIHKYNPYGINLDFIRYFVFWEGVHENSSPEKLPQTCFCNRCINLFFSKLNTKLPNNLNGTPEIASYILNNYKDEWTNFKVDTITQVVKSITESAKAVKPDIRFNIHGVPWKLGEFGNAIHSIAGQDYKALSKYIDGISPMCYTGMLKRKAEWINEITKDIHNQASIDILPAFQGVAMYDSESISNKDFKELIQECLKAPSSGVAFWPWEQISDEHKRIIGKII